MICFRVRDGRASKSRLPRFDNSFTAVKCNWLEFVPKIRVARRKHVAHFLKTTILPWRPSTEQFPCFQVLWFPFGAPVALPPCIRHLPPSFVAGERLRAAAV